jgi:hypothetical protein
LNRDDIHDFSRFGNSSFARDHVADRKHLETAAALTGNILELLLDPAPCCADTAYIGFGIRQGVARTEAHELPDVRLDALRRDSCGQFMA